MSKCPICKSPHYVHRCMACLHSETPKVKKGVKPCEWPCTATINVLESDTGRPVEGVYTLLDGVSDKTDVHGFRVVEKLAPGDHAASIVAATLGDRYAFPVGQDGSVPVTKNIGAGENEFYTFVLDPLRPLKVIVRRRHDSAGVPNAKVKLTPGKSGNKVATPELTTANPGEVIFKRLRQDTYKLEIELDAPGKLKYELEESDISHVLDMSKTQDEIIVWVKLVVHLRLKYLCPDTKSRHFPKDFPVVVVFDDAKTLDLKVLDDEGYFKFPIEDDQKKKFTLKFDSAKSRYLVHPAREMPDPAASGPGSRSDLPKTKVFEDPTETQLQEWTLAHKKLFALPKTWSLVHSEWTQVDVSVAANGEITIGNGVGEVGKPAELTLKPKFQYVRFEFHDRKYGQKGLPHNGVRVGIPAIVLKGCRQSTDAGAPVSPVSGTHDAVSNWVVNEGANDTACQVLPWIKLKDDAGAVLPKFNNKLMLEFGWENAYVHSTGENASDRKIIVLPANDERRKPNKNRPQYYDLPKLWKSKWYYTRLADPSKNKFFDKFSDADDADLEASLAEAGKLIFSLDDIVLLDAAGSQAIKDRKLADNAELAGLVKNSRFAILEMNRAEKFKVQVFEPRPDAVFWSNSDFVADAPNGVPRNLIAVYPPNPRAVVFCNNFHDIFDKRCEPADCSSKQIMGARAAKIEDTDVSSRKRIFDQANDATNAYVGYTNGGRLHYLHYWEVDGATVYSAIVSYWSAFFQKKTIDSANGTDADVAKFRKDGMALAMKRWNDKDYYFEENDDKTDLRVKQFALFESKGVESSPGIVPEAGKVGGKYMCLVWVRDDKGGSSAASDGSYMTMRKSGARDEGKRWGNAPGNDLNVPKFEGGDAHPRCAFAHELGHSHFGLYDSYLTTYGKLCTTGNKNAKLSTVLCCYENMYADKKEGQEYLGMPYEMDTGAIMYQNRAEARLRYAWLRANWLNDQAKPGGQDKLPEFLGNRRFRAAYEAPGKPKLKYHRDDSERNIYKPSKSSGPGYSLGNQGKADLHLYKLGDDEFSRILRGGPYKGVLVVSVKILVKFEKFMPWAKKAKYFVDDVVVHATKFYKCKTEHSNKDFDANDWNQILDEGDPKLSLADWCVSGQSIHTADMFGNAIDKVFEDLELKQKIKLMEDLNAFILDKMGDDRFVGKFKLYGGGDFSPALIRIFPQWSFETDPGGAHMTLIYHPLSKAFQPNGATLRVGLDGELDTIFRYLLGKLGDDPAKWAAEGLTGDIARTDLTKLSDWMNANASGTGFIVADNP